MHTIIEETLKLPRDEKIAILYWLRENLETGDDAIENNGLSEEIMSELKRRELLVETGEEIWISKEELFDFLKQRLNAS
jgi:hypothetical protein